MIVNGVNLKYPPDLSEQEALEILAKEIMCWQREYTHKTLGEVEIEVGQDDEGEYLEITAKEKSSIRRIRRITGYLAPIQSFNDAKQRELEDRYSHLTLDQRAIRD